MGVFMGANSRFWEALSVVPQHALSGSTEAIVRALKEAAEHAALVEDALSERRRALLLEMAEVYGVNIAWPDAGPSAAPAGVSVVTCSRNRTENLLKALPSWLDCPDVSEVIVVDWTSQSPVSEALDAAGVTDPRVRVLRVEGEPRWILAHAFNAGFQHAVYDKILKADADIVLDPAFFRRNVLRPGEFIAGNWRRASDDQAHVNGFFYVWRDRLMGVGGFNEYITTYGWDDDELYARLAEDGQNRTDVAGGTIYHLPHDDAARTEKAPPPAGAPAAETLPTQTVFLGRRNRQLANLMPAWSPNRPPVTYAVEREFGRVTVLRREPGSGDAPPPSIQREAFLSAARELLAWRLGDVCYRLDHARVEALVDTLAWDDIGQADVVAMLAEPAPRLHAERRWFFLNIGAGPVTNYDELKALADKAEARGLTPVWISDALDGAHAALGPDAPRPAADPLNYDDLVNQASLDKRVYMHTPAAPAPAPAPAQQQAFAPARPHVAAPRAKLFVDGQHGLGNRLRAIGSGAAIANATGREMVVVWEPDDHCDCRFSDLFDYAGAVIEKAFPQDASETGAALFNYMEIEEGAQKDAPVALEEGRDAYLRSAYVLNHPASDWAAENAFLRSLRPVESVRALIEAVRAPNDLTAHIRMVGGKQFEHLPWESADNWTEEGHELVDHWRTKSHYSNFITRIDALVAAGEVSTMFIAADMPETYQVFQERYGDRVTYLPREVNDRSAAQLRYALADATLLSRAPRMLGSTWSSFSELAQRLADPPMTVEMSGTDF